MGFAANGHHRWFGISDAARFVFFAADTVDDMPFGVSNGGSAADRANNVDLVVFPGKIASIDIHNMIGIVQAEHGVGSVPVDVVNFLALSHSNGKHKDSETKHLSDFFHFDGRRLFSSVVFDELTYDTRRWSVVVQLGG